MGGERRQRRWLSYLCFTVLVLLSSLTIPAAALRPRSLGKDNRQHHHHSGPRIERNFNHALLEENSDGILLYPGGEALGVGSEAGIGGGGGGGGGSGEEDEYDDGETGFVVDAGHDSSEGSDPSDDDDDDDVSDEDAYYGDPNLGRVLPNPSYSPQSGPRPNAHKKRNIMAIGVPRLYLPIMNEPMDRFTRRSVIKRTIRTHLQNPGGKGTGKTLLGLSTHPLGSMDPKAPLQTYPNSLNSIIKPLPKELPNSKVQYSLKSPPSVLPKPGIPNTGFPPLQPSLSSLLPKSGVPRISLFQPLTNPVKPIADLPPPPASQLPPNPDSGNLDLKSRVFLSSQDVSRIKVVQTPSPLPIAQHVPTFKLPLLPSQHNPGALTGSFVAGQTKANLPPPPPPPSLTPRPNVHNFKRAPSIPSLSTEPMPNLNLSPRQVPQYQQYNVPPSSSQLQPQPDPVLSTDPISPPPSSLSDTYEPSYDQSQPSSQMSLLNSAQPSPPPPRVSNMMPPALDTSYLEPEAEDEPEPIPIIESPPGMNITEPTLTLIPVITSENASNPAVPSLPSQDEAPVQAAPNFRTPSVPEAALEDALDTGGSQIPMIQTPPEMNITQPTLALVEVPEESSPPEISNPPYPASRQLMAPEQPKSSYADYGQRIESQPQDQPVPYLQQQQQPVDSGYQEPAPPLRVQSEPQNLPAVPVSEEDIPVVKDELLGLNVSEPTLAFLPVAKTASGEEAVVIQQPEELPNPGVQSVNQPGAQVGEVPTLPVIDPSTESSRLAGGSPGLEPQSIPGTESVAPGELGVVADLPVQLPANVPGNEPAYPLNTASANVPGYEPAYPLNTDSVNQGPVAIPREYSGEAQVPYGQGRNGYEGNMNEVNRLSLQVPQTPQREGEAMTGFDGDVPIYG